MHAVREAMRAQLATALLADWEQAYEPNQVTGGYTPDPASSGRRALANLALTHALPRRARLAATPSGPASAYQRFKDAGNMTDRFNALSALVASGHATCGAGAGALPRDLQGRGAGHRQVVLAAGAAPLIAAATSCRCVKQLMQHPDFSINNPNRARSVIFSYCSGNPAPSTAPTRQATCSGADRVIELDAINPQVAARLARALDRWSKLAEPYRSAAREAIARVAAQPGPQQGHARSRHPRAGSLTHQRPRYMAQQNISPHPVPRRTTARRRPHPGQLRLLLEVVARACKSISQAVNKGALGGVLGSADSENVQGEVQKKLDIIANEVLIEANEWGGHLAAMASEEMDSIYVVPNRYPQGEYLLLFDPARRHRATST